MKLLLFFFAFLLIQSISYSLDWMNISPANVHENLYSVKFVSNDTGYAVGWGSSGGIFLRTTDYGQNWDIDKQKGWYPFVVNTAGEDNQIILAAGYATDCNCGLFLIKTPGSPIYKDSRFDDFGLPFNYNFYDIYVADYQTYLLAGYNGVIFKTTNQGVNWNKCNIPPTNDILKKFIFQDSAKGFVLGGPKWYKNDRIYNTTNGGNNWYLFQDFSNDDITVNGMMFVDSTKIFLYGSKENKEAILLSTNAGINWKIVYNGDSLVSLVYSYRIDDNIYVFAENGKILVSTNLGDNWSISSSSLPKTQITNYQFVDNSKISAKAIVSGEDGLILKYDSPLSVNNQIKSNYNTENLINFVSVEKKFIFPSEFLGKEYKLLIYDPTGRLIYNDNGSILSTEAKIGELKNGIYFANFRVEGKIHTVKILNY